MFKRWTIEAPETARHEGYMKFNGPRFLLDAVLALITVITILWNGKLPESIYAGAPIPFLQLGK